MIPGPNLDLSCIGQLGAAHICEIYAKFYFDAKHLERGLNPYSIPWWCRFWCPIFQNKALFDQYWILP